MTYTAESLDIALEHSLGTTTLRVGGEVDLATAAQLRDALLDALVCGSGVAHLDLDGVTFMDTAGIHTLLAGVRRASLMGGHVGMTSASGPVRRVLGVAGVRDSFADPACSCALPLGSP
ncbi:MAG: STAS domain-containing protein [Sporichthyaceae bacterium]|nr:STAS domain-containing protein [Sporichthyaceae bacterium]